MRQYQIIARGEAECLNFISVMTICHALSVLANVRSAILQIIARLQVPSKLANYRYITPIKLLYSGARKIFLKEQMKPK